MLKIKLNIRLKLNKIYWKKNVYGLDLSLKSITNVLNNHVVHSISIMHLVSLIDSTPVLRVSLIKHNSFICSLTLTTLLWSVHNSLHLFSTTLQFKSYLAMRCLALAPSMECLPYRPIPDIICTVLFLWAAKLNI